MGVVLRVRDGGLGRDLAAKVLLPEQRGQEAAVHRFLEEARITGQLQHPGVPPVHDLGQLADGRPFFTMKLVRGDTLATLLRQRPDPTAQRPRFLKVFEQLCQTVAYAHSKGVIHRDLKPSNVMVGRFGEVQVMDWGLAKILASRERERPEEAEPPSQVASIIDTQRDSTNELLTQAGSILGTFAYMPPEQARGESERLDERCDVFGLGAVLCQILTGLPPYSDPDREVVRARARRGDLTEAFARLEACGADAELLALAKRCLAAEPGERPRDAGEVAQAMTAYLAAVEERVRQAEVERAAAQARAEEARAKAVAERRARRLTLALAVAVLVVLVAGGAGAWLIQQQAQARATEALRRQAEVDGAVRTSIGEGKVLLDQARSAPLKDPAHLLKAQAVAHKAVELARASEASAELRHEAAALLDEVQAEVAAQQKDRRLLARLSEVRGPREGPRFRKDDKGSLIVLPEPSADEQFAQAFRDWGLDVDRTPTAQGAARLRSRPAVLTEVIAALDDWAIERQQSQKKLHVPAQRLAALVAALDDGPGAARRRELRAMLARGRLLVERATAWLTMLLRPGGLPAPIDFGLGADRSRLQRLAQQTDPAAEPVLGLLTLVRALRVAGHEWRAEMLLRAAVRARPQEVVLRTTLGDLLEGQKSPRWQEVVACYEAARALRPELGESLAWALLNSGRVVEALALYQRLREEQPDNPWLHFHHSNALWGQHRYKEAEAVCRAAIRLKPDYYLAHYGLGRALNGQGRHKEAEAAYREAIRLRRDDAWGHSHLGAALFGQGRYKEAEKALREAIRLAPDDHVAHTNLGNALVQQHRAQEAENAYREAIRLQPDNPLAYSNLSGALFLQGRYKEAEAALREAIRLKPDFAGAHSNLSISLRNQGRYKEAEAACREAIRLKPDLGRAHSNLAWALLGQRRYPEAEAACREAIRLEPKFALTHRHLGDALYAQLRHKEAEAAYRKAIRLEPDPDRSGAHTNLGNALCAQQRYREAEVAYSEAIRLKPQSPEAHCNLGLALHEQGRAKEAEPAYREAIRLKPDYPEAHMHLGRALVVLRRFKEAEASAREAVRLKPDSSQVHFYLGCVLAAQNIFREATFREAIRLQPDFPLAHYQLGLGLAGQGRHKEAEAALREAIRLQSNLPKAHTSLGFTLYAQRRYKEAEAPFREAIRLKPNDPQAHNGLGLALRDQGRPKEAEKPFREAIRLQPDFPRTHYDLGIALHLQGRYKEAEAAYREAIRLKPNYPEAHYHLGIALHLQGRHKEAEAAYREAIHLKPNYPQVYYNLGNMVRDQGRVKEAEAAYREAIRLKPDIPEAHCNLGHLLRRQGRFAEALEALRRGHALGNKAPNWRYPSADWVRHCERLVVLERDLPAVLQSKKQPANATERLEFADLCQHLRRHSAATRFYADAFAADPKLAAEQQGQHRYKAVRSAALAVAGKAEDAKELAVEEWVWLQQRAHDWLRADLTTYSGLVEKANPATRQSVQQRLAQWQSDPDLLAVRDQAWLAAMPEADCAQWQQLWADIEALRKKAAAR
jgi:serine/threonine-protein kinase